MTGARIYVIIQENSIWIMIVVFKAAILLTVLEVI